MPGDTISPSDGTTPVTLPALDPCCQSPCDPPWLPASACIIFTETQTITTPLKSDPASNDVGRGGVAVTVIFTHDMCLIGKQHGGLAYTLTLLPGEKMTVYHSDRYRRTTSETMRFSSQTTFSLFAASLFQLRTSNDSSMLANVMNSSASGGSSSSAVNPLDPFSWFGGNGGSSSSNSSSGSLNVSTQSAADNFVSIASQSAFLTDQQRSLTISSYEDSETVNTTQRVLVNNNICYAVNYFVRKVLDVYTSSTTVTAVTFQVTAGAYVSPVLTAAQIGQLPAQYQAEAKAALQAAPKVGEVIQHPTRISVPTDGVVYDPELAHCCALDPELELAAAIKAEREQAEAQKLGLQVQLMALEVQRRQALLAAGTLTPFDPIPAETIVA
jgi:hypothetical protein